MSTVTEEGLFDVKQEVNDTFNKNSFHGLHILSISAL